MKALSRFAVLALAAIGMFSLTSDGLDYILGALNPWLRVPLWIAAYMVLVEVLWALARKGWGVEP